MSQVGTLRLRNNRITLLSSDKSNIEWMAGRGAQNLTKGSEVILDPSPYC